MKNLALPLFAIQVIAQAQTVGPMRGLPPQASQSIRSAPRLQAPDILRSRKPAEFRLAGLSDAEQKRLSAPSGQGLKRAGLHRSMDAAAFSAAGIWTQTPDGKRIWRAAVHSPGARGIRFHFTQFRVPNGGRVWLHDDTGLEIAGPYMANGIWNDGDFWTDVVLSESASIVYEPDASDSANPGRGMVPFQVAEVSHLTAEALPEEKAGPAAAAASCNLDVTCYGDYANLAKAVGRYIFEQNGDSYFCSGTLLNTRNSSGIPYFLTANHCVSTEAVARTVVVFWFYQTNECRGTPPRDRDVPRTNGATLLATLSNTRGDGTLLRLTGVPEGVTFAGWTADPVSIGTNVVGIHHPAGDYKRISFGSLQTPTRFSGYALENFQGAFWDGGGLTEGGSSGSGLFTRDGILFGMLSHGPKFDTAAQYCAGIPFADNYGKFSVFFPQIRDFLEERTTTPVVPPGLNPADSRALASGTAVSVDLAAVASPTLLGAPNMFRIVVPAGSTRLDIRVTSTPNVSLSIYARLNNLPAVESGRVTADNSDESDGGNKTFSITQTSNPPLRAGTYYIRIGLFTTNVRTSATVTATVASGGGPLVSGVPAPFRFGPFSGAGIAPYSFTIDVPPGATNLTVRLVSQNPSIDVDLYMRFNQDIGISNGRIVADHRSEDFTGNETISIGNTSSPPLRAGTYYITMVLYQPNEISQGTITATVTGGTTSGSAQIPTFGTTLLSSGQTVNLTIPGTDYGTLLRGNRGYRIEVPQGATRLEIRLNINNPLHDLDLYARYNQETVITGGFPMADHYSENLFGSESIVITPNSNPPLRTGVYFISIGVFRENVAIAASLQATVTTEGQTAPNLLTPAVPRNFSLPAVSAATLFNGANGFTINVPANAAQLEIRTNTTTPNTDVDLYLRRGSDVTIVQGQVVYDRRDNSVGSSKTIVIRTSDGLREGTYYAALLVYSPNRAVSGTIVANISTTSGTATRTVLTPSRPAAFRIGPSTGGRLYNGVTGFSIDVPEGVSRVDIRLNTTTPNADVDLYARHSVDVDMLNGTANADFYSESFSGSESITISADTTPVLKPGTYFIALGLFTPNLVVEGTVTAFLTGTGPSATPTAVTNLAPGVPVRFDLPAVERPTVFTGDYSYRIDVPTGATQLIVRLNSETPNVDTDLYIRAGSDVNVTDNGVTSDYSSTSRLANETIVIDASSTPPLRAGTYYISIGSYTLGARASGTISASVERPSGTAPISGARTLVSGTAVEFNIPAVTAPALMQGDLGYRIEVPANSASLLIELNANPTTLDLDLHARFGAEPNVVNGRINADYNSAGDTGVERIEINSLSVPPLRPGTYFISFSAWSPGIPIRGTIKATVAANRSATVDGELTKKTSNAVEVSTGPVLTALPERKPAAFGKAAPLADVPAESLLKNRKVASVRNRVE
jgi:hypothetical protein